MLENDLKEDKKYENKIKNIQEELNKYKKFEKFMV